MTLQGKNWRLFLFFLLWSVAACFLWKVGAGAHGQMQRLQDNATLRLGAGAPASDSFRSMQETEARADLPVPFALWTSQKRQDVEAPSTGRSTESDVVLAEGNTRLVLPLAQTLEEQDRSGCLLDRETALSLFGSANVEGLTIRWNGSEYLVRGVFAGPAGTVVVRPHAGGSIPMNSVALGDAEQAEAFAMRHGLTVEFAVKNSAFTGLSRIFSSLPQVVLALLALEFLLRVRRENRAYPVREALLTLLLLALTTAFVLWALTLLPKGWIPTRWSDFSFWSRSFADAKKQAAGFFSMEQHKPDLLLLQTAAASLAGVPGALFLLPCRRLLERMGIFRQGQ